MDTRNTDEILEQAFSGDPPGRILRAKVLLDSTAALAGRRRVVRPWPMAALSAAAVLIAAFSFLLGRWSMGPASPQPTTVPVAAGGAATVAVPSDVIAWLDAARLFGQLGMTDRMARAVERAGRLLPVNTAVADGQTLQVFAAGGSMGDQKKSTEPADIPGPHPSVERVNRILAQSLGD